MTERPTEFPEWGTNADSLIKAPSIEKRKIGYSIDTTTGLTDIPSLRGENWFRNLVYKWIIYFDDKIASINTNISHFTVTEEEKKTEFNKWIDLNSFKVPKGKWLFNISFRHYIIRANYVKDLSIKSAFVSGISSKSGDLTNLKEPDPIEKLKKIVTVGGIGNNLFTSFLSKEHDLSMGYYGQNAAFSCVIDALKDETYYVKNFCYATPDGSEDYRIFYQINAIKIG